MSSNTSDYDQSAEKEGIQKATPIIAGLMASVVLWSFIFTPAPGNPYDDIMAKLLGPGPVVFASLGFAVTLLIPGAWSLRGVLIALATAVLLTVGIWLSA